MLARYILCDGPLLVRPSVLLGAEGPHDAKSCRGTRVATSSSTRPITKDAQQWRGRSIHAAYCYWGCGRTTGCPTYRLCFAFLVLLEFLVVECLTSALHTTFEVNNDVIIKVKSYVYLLCLLCRTYTALAHLHVILRFCLYMYNRMLKMSVDSHPVAHCHYM